MRRCAPLLLIFAVATLASGCGSKTQTGTTPQAWAKSVCGTFVRSERALHKKVIVLLGREKRAQPPAAKAYRVEVFRQAISTSDRELAEIRRIGPPDVEHGREIQRILESIIEKSRTAHVNGEMRSKRLVTSSRAALRRGFARIETQYGTELGRIAATIEEFERFPSEELNQAVHDEPSCQNPLFRGESGPAPDVASLFWGLVIGEG